MTLDLLPRIDGIVLTFIETGARAEDQQSKRFETPQAKLAAVVNAVADVVIGERRLNLYARTFAYTHEEYENITGAIDRFERREIRLLMKETPHDFFLAHPNDTFAGRIARPTIIEFDVAGEFNGQGLIANTWPEYVLGRWTAFVSRPHVIGYSARVAEIDEVAGGIAEYPVKPPPGQWSWVEDAARARQYQQWITTGWPKETRGYENPYGGLAFSER